MDMRAGVGLRLLRALILAAVAFLGGLIGHVTADGLVPGLRGLVLLFVICAAGAAVFLERPASTRRVVFLLMAGQTFIHVGLTAMAGHVGDASGGASTTPRSIVVPPSVSVDRNGSLFDQYVAMTSHADSGAPLVVPSWLQHLVADMTGPHALMALGHLAAAALVGVWLASGERAFWTLVSLTATALSGLVASLFAVLRGALGIKPTRTVAAVAGGQLDRRALILLLLGSTLSRRGPPALLGA